MSIIELPVSIGEALDKLTILDIKLENIQNEHKRQDCKVEKEALHTKLAQYVEKYSFWYAILKEINAEIWRLQDILRTSTNTEDLAKHVLDLNDIRFRIKNKLNIYSTSYLKEQKGYAAKNLLLLQPITLINAFKYKNILYYLSIEYDTIFLTISDWNLKELFQENIVVLPEDKLSEYKNSCRVYEKELSNDIISEFNLLKPILSKLSPKTGLFISHLGLGDMINMNGAVNYLTKDYDEIFLVCYAHNYQNVRTLYHTNPKIKILTINTENDIWIYQTWNPFFTYIASFFSKVWKSGIFLENHEPCIELPNCFYRDLGLPTEIWQTQSQLPKLQESRQLFEKLQGIPYIFVQQQASDASCSLIQWNKNTILTIDPNVNVYSPSDSFFELAEACRGKPFFHYIDLLANAEEIHVLDSAFCTLLFLIPTVHIKVKKIYDRYTCNDTIYTKMLKEKELLEILHTSKSNP